MAPDDFTIESTAALSLDRGGRVGNSPGADGRGRVHVKIANTGAEPLPIVIIPASEGMPVFKEAYATLTTPGTPQTLITATVPALKTWLTEVVFVSCRGTVRWELKENGTTRAAGNTGPGHADSNFPFDPARPFPAGAILTVEILHEADEAPTLVDATLMVSEV